MSVWCVSAQLELSHEPRTGLALHRPRPGDAPASHRGRLGITERHAYAVVTDLSDAGYVVKTREGRRNRYQVQNHLLLPDLKDREQAIGEVLDVLTGRAVNGSDSAGEELIDRLIHSPRVDSRLHSWGFVGAPIFAGDGFAMGEPTASLDLRFQGYLSARSTAGCRKDISRPRLNDRSSEPRPETQLGAAKLDAVKFLELNQQ